MSPTRTAATQAEPNIAQTFDLKRAVVEFAHGASTGIKVHIATQFGFNPEAIVA